MTDSTDLIPRPINTENSIHHSCWVISKNTEKNEQVQNCVFIIPYYTGLILTNLCPMHPFFDPWNGVEKGCIGDEWAKHLLRAGAFLFFCHFLNPKTLNLNTV